MNDCYEMGLSLDLHVQIVLGGGRIKKGYCCRVRGDGVMTRDEVIKSMMKDIKQYQEEEGLTNGQVMMDVIAALNPAMFRANFGNDPKEWNRLREEAGKNDK
jgi:hypothetical protein